MDRMLTDSRIVNKSKTSVCKNADLQPIMAQDVSANYEKKLNLLNLNIEDEQKTSSRNV